METDVVRVPEAEWAAGLTDAQRHAAASVLSDLIAREDVLGIVLASSLLRGEGGPTSDLDIFVVIASPWRQRRQLLIDGVRIEVFLNPPWVVRWYFAEDARDATPSTASMLATGRMVYARGPTLGDLRDEAARILEQGPPALTEAELTMRTYGIIDHAEDAEDVLGSDPDALAYLLPFLVDRAVMLLYARARRWQPKSKRLPADLARFDSVAADLLRHYLREPDLGRRHALARELAERAIAPRPCRFFAWESMLEEMPFSGS